MSTRTSRILLAGLFGIAIACILSGPTQAQQKGGDILDEAKQRQQVAVQQAEEDAKKALSEARGLARKDVKGAVSMLIAVRDNIGLNTDLPEEKRKALVNNLNFAIDAYQHRVVDSPAPSPLNPPIRTGGDKKPMDDKRVADAAKTEQNRVKGALDPQAELKAQREGNFLRVQNDVDATSIPQVEDIKFPRDWAEKTAKRQGVKLTPEERKIMEALAKPLTVELPDSTLETVLDYLKDKCKVEIIVPQKILDDQMITYKTPVSVNLKDVTMRTILKKVLADVGLVYIVKDNVIQVTTPEIAAKTLTTRTYYMGDLLSANDLRMPAYARQAEAMRTIQDLVGVIVGTVEPNSWWVNGGLGRIVFDPRTMTLVVTQTAEVHYMLNLKR